MVFLILFCCVFLVLGWSWSDVVSLLNDSIGKNIFPGFGCLVMRNGTVLLEEYVGRGMYNESSFLVNEETLFDLASLTKVLITTTAIEQFYERGEMKLSDTISKYFPEFGGEGKMLITIEDCLLHQAGFPSYPFPGYWEAEFGCNESKVYFPKLVTDCQDRIKRGWYKQKLIYPIGSKFLYSDLSFISLHYVIGKLAKEKGYVSSKDLSEDCSRDSETCYYNAYVRKFILEKMGMKMTSFNPKCNVSTKNRKTYIYKNCSPTFYDALYRHRLSFGYCCNRDSFANGGVNGHAGVFSNARDIAILLNDFMFTNTLISRKVIDEFTKVKNSTVSSRGLGWDTNIFKNSTCGSLSQKTYFHTGYTGTQVCNDPERKVITILLTNRCYPNDQHKTEIQEIRRRFNTLVQQIIDSE